MNVMDARVRSSQGHDEETGTHGRFDFDDVYAGVPLRIVVDAFGYLPLDTTVVPDDEGRHDFELRPDPIAEAMIAAQVERLEARAGDLLYTGRPALDRTLMAPFASRTNLRQMLERRYPLDVLRRVGCVMLDERPIETREEIVHMLEYMIPEELERVEILEFPRMGPPTMLRIYTRPFFMRLIGSNEPLQEPMMHPKTDLCR